MPLLTELAPFASHPERSRGRLHPEPEPTRRSCFQRDRDRVIHSTAFRRLKHKTQVFVYHEGDHYRTRLTHTLEVAQIARSISRSLGLDEDLAEAVALAHDLGHTPFGHAGEEALDAATREIGGFDHNVQTVRILTRLEQHYAEFDGLNPTWETIEGVVKHNGPLLGAHAGERALPPVIAELDAARPLMLDGFAGAEAQVATLADDIAYNNHDIDDGLRAGLFEFEEVRALPLIGEIIAEVEARYPGIERPRLVHESIRRMIDRMVGDLLAETERRATAHTLDSSDAVRALDRPLVAFSDEMLGHFRALRAFLRQRMYRHYRVNRSMAKARRMLGELYDALAGEPSTLPPEWQSQTDGAGTPRTRRVVADYIAGMTDRYALLEHRRLFDRFAQT
jgi:dGTPase